MNNFAAKYIAMDKDDKPKGRGGRREGAGRPKGDSKLYTFRASGRIAEIIDTHENKTEFIRDCIEETMRHGRGLETLGEIMPAYEVTDVSLPFFDNVKVAAGFPIPLDNDERAQNIELLQMLCPNPESCYLIRVQGDSMIDADIRSGDIVIIDKSNRNPSDSEVAMCELNGEYTIKRIRRRQGEMRLVPANPDYPEIEIKKSDDFSVWGVVTYVIHKPKS